MLPRALSARIEHFERLVREELAPNPSRLRTSLRIALICALGIALMAVMHIRSVLGAYTLWGLTSTPGTAIRPIRAVMLIAVVGIALALSILLGGILVQAPWLYLPFLGAVAITFTYLINIGVLGSYWLYVEILSLGTMYDAIFSPYDLGWPTAYTFAGVAIAISLISIFDVALWPDPAEGALCASLARGFERNRKRLESVGPGYFDEAHAAALRPSASVSILPIHLPLLNRARAENPDPGRYAGLLAAVTVDERMHMEIGRLVLLARERVGRALRTRMQTEIEAVLGAFDTMIARVRDHAAAGLKLDVAWPVSPVEFLHTRLAALESRAASITCAFVPESELAELTNLASFIATLRMLAERVTRPPESMPPLQLRSAGPPRPGAVVPRDPERIRYCLKLGVAVMGVFIAGLVTQRAELDTIVWTALIVGLPTYGATLRKMVLRIGGVIIGGAIAILAMLIVSPNFETVVAYATVFVVVLYIAAYCGLSSGRINYLGKQIGVTFVLAYAALAPSADVYTPLWRVWAVFLGIVVTTAVFLIIWPDYARNALVRRLTAILRETLSVLPGNEKRVGADAIHAAASRIIETLAELLGAADDARLEGKRSGVDPESVIEASGTLRRVGYNLATISLGRLAAEQPALGDPARAAQVACEAEAHNQIDYWMKYFTAAQEGGQVEPSRLTRPSPPSLRLDACVREFEERVAADGFASIAGWSPPARDSLLTELQTWRRVAYLMPELDSHLTHSRSV